MSLFPETFVSALVWIALGLVMVDVLVLAVLWLRDASRRDLW